MRWACGYVKSNGNDLFYTRTGGDKSPVLLAHGGTDDSACWMDFAKLLEKDYDVVMYDALGHGNSSRSTMDMPIDLVSDMDKVIKDLKLQKPAIWGHSLGAATTAGYAALHSNEINLIVLEDVPWFQDPKKLDEQVKKPYDIADLQKGTLNEIIELSRKIHPRHMDSIHERWALSKMKFDTAFMKRDLKHLILPKWEELASKITCPTLLLTADVDKGAIVTPEVAVKALDILPNAQWAYIPHAGHSIRYEQFTLVMGVVMNYLRHNYQTGVN
jgi:N-formylmaleamate deformylase